MRKKLEQPKAITLITLVITIIILIILTGVAINLGIGDNRIFNKAKVAKEKYNEESIREKVELGIMDLEIDEIALGNQVTIESVLQELLEKEIFETIDKDTYVGNIGEYEVKLKYNENQKVEIEYIEKATGVRVTYKLNPDSYTNGEKVGILLTVDGKVKSIIKPDNLVIYPTKSIIGINYKVTENGKYTFIIEDGDGNKQEKNVIVDIIDRLAPNDFEITAQSNRRKISITSNITDAESDGVSVKSGIGKYEYYIKGPENSDYIKYETNEVEVASDGTYSVYAIAYDKAGNSKTSNTVNVAVEKIAKPVITKLSGTVGYVLKEDEFQQVDYPKVRIIYGKNSGYKNYYSYDNKNWIEVNDPEIELEVIGIDKKIVYAKTIDTEIEESAINYLQLYASYPIQQFNGYLHWLCPGANNPSSSWNTATFESYIDSSVWGKTYKIFLNEYWTMDRGGFGQGTITFYDENNNKIDNSYKILKQKCDNKIYRQGDPLYPATYSITIPTNAVRMEIYIKLNIYTTADLAGIEFIMPYPY